MADLAPEAFVVTTSRWKHLSSLLEIAAFAAATTWLALRSGDVWIWIAATFFAAFLAFALTRRPWSRSVWLTVTDSGVIPRRGPMIPWVDIENVALGRSGRVWRGRTLAIWVRPSASYFTESSRIASIRRIGRRLLPGSPTFVVSSKTVSVPLDRVMAEIVTRSGQAWPPR